MKFEIKLKNIKHAAFASQETHCFTATVYLNGERFCTVENDGRGGCDDFRPLKGDKNSEIYAKIKEINAELSKEIIKGDGFEIENDIEIVIGDLVNEWLQEKEVKKVLKKIAYIKKGGDLYTVNLKPTAENINRVKQQKWWDKSNICLNHLPFEQAKTYIQ